MKRMFRVPGALSLMLAVTLAAGCNVFEGMYEEGASDDPQVLYEDARIALQRNEPEAAVGHLRKALAQEPRATPLRKRIQIKLATAVLQTREINVLTLTRIAEKLSGQAASAASLGKDGEGAICNFNPADPHEAFDPREGIDYDRIGAEASDEVIGEADDLISAVFAEGEDGQVTPPEHTFEDLDAKVAALQAQGLTDAEIAEAIANYAVAVMTQTYLDILAVGGAQATFFYVDPPATNQFVGLCFADLASCENTVAWIKANVGGTELVTRLLEKRAELLASTTAAELATMARAAYDQMVVGLETASCTQLP